MKFLIDTGASKNFIRPHKGLRGVRPVSTPFRVHSIHGSINVTQKCFVALFNTKATFFLLPDLLNFDGKCADVKFTDIGAPASVQRTF